MGKGIINAVNKLQIWRTFANNNFIYYIQEAHILKDQIWTNVNN